MVWRSPRAGIGLHSRRPRRPGGQDVADLKPVLQRATAMDRWRRSATQQKIRPWRPAASSGALRLPHEGWARRVQLEGAADLYFASVTSRSYPRPGARVAHVFKTRIELRTSACVTRRDCWRRHWQERLRCAAPTGWASSRRCPSRCQQQDLPMSPMEILAGLCGRLLSCQTNENDLLPRDQRPLFLRTRAPHCHAVGEGKVRGSASSKRGGGAADDGTELELSRSSGRLRAQRDAPNGRSWDTQQRVCSRWRCGPPRAARGRGPRR